MAEVLEKKKNENLDNSNSSLVLPNNKMAEVLEKQKDEPQAASSAHCYAGPGDVTCDSCIEGKFKAVNSCLVCQASYCEDHLQPHYRSPAFKKHKLVKAGAGFQNEICSQHDKLMEIYCRTDQSLICYLCMMEKHKTHDTVTAKAERTEKQEELQKEQTKSQQRIQEKQKEIHGLKQTVDTIKRRSQAAVEDSERIFTELISFMEKKRSEVKELIRAHEETELSRAEQLLKQLEQEIADLQKRITELEQLSHTDDHIHFLQSFPSLHVSPGCDDSPRFTVNLSFNGVRKSLSELKKRVEEISVEEFNKSCTQAAASQLISPSEPETREDFLQYLCSLTLDPNTAHQLLTLSEKNRAVTRSNTEPRYSDHPERFNYWEQVLCKESVSGRRYWEVEWSGGMDISVSYKKISRKGQGNECRFGFNNQSWSLQCFSASTSFWHNHIWNEVRSSASSRVGVYVDHGEGTLSFYSVSDTMELLHRVHTTFTQPLYVGFGLWNYISTLRNTVIGVNTGINQALRGSNPMATIQALAASGGQTTISSLECGSKVLIGGSGGQRSGLPSSLFLNHPSLLPMAAGAALGLGNSIISKSGRPLFPGGMSPSPCSSPDSSCSSSDLLHSPQDLGSGQD